MYQTLNLEREGGVVTLTLNQPRSLNAMSHQMAEEFQQAILEIARDPEARFLILTGHGEAFCSGGDFNTIIRDLERPGVEYRDVASAFYKKFLSLRDLPIPTLAAVNGHAAGGGFCLALACDMRIASTRARFGMSFVRIGLHPGMGGTYFLPRLVGTARAFEIFLTGETLSAEEALKMGLVNRVVEHEELSEAARGLARKISTLPQFPIRYMKRSIYMGAQADLQEILELEAFAQALCSETEDLREGIAAFREKRPPRYR